MADTDIDDLFTLPLEEFTAARNVLAASLKAAGRGEDAAAVKALTKPPLSAWAVNQLYWHHRKPFEQLMTAGERLRRHRPGIDAAGKRRGKGKGARGGGIARNIDQQYALRSGQACGGVASRAYPPPISPAV